MSNPGAVMAVLTSAARTETAVRTRDTLLRRMLTPTPSFTLARPGATDRARMEAFVVDRFQSVWHAHVTQFLPFLLGMQCGDSCTAVAGIRPATGTALFLERYLDTNAETALSALTGKEVPRAELAEIGNLVAGQRGASHLLFLVFTAALHRAGYRWIVFTATRALRNNLDKLGYPLLTLAPASADRLDAAARAEWGTYYDSEPLVMAGSLDDAMRLIEERPLLRRVLRLYRTAIAEIAFRLRAGHE
jgi:hypothetical protein